MLKITPATSVQNLCLQCITFDTESHFSQCCCRSMCGSEPHCCDSTCGPPIWKAGKSLVSVSTLLPISNPLTF